MLIYLVHGTFVGNDILGLLTELSRFAPALSQKLSAASAKASSIDFYWRSGQLHADVRSRTARRAFSKGANREDLPVEALQLVESKQPHRAGRRSDSIDCGSRPIGRATDSYQPRVQIWGHSHGGNVMALVSQLLGADQQEREQFFHATRSFYQSMDSGRLCDMPIWQQVRRPA